MAAWSLISNHPCVWCETGVGISCVSLWPTDEENDFLQNPNTQQATPNHGDHKSLKGFCVLLWSGIASRGTVEPRLNRD